MQHPDPNPNPNPNPSNALWREGLMPYRAKLVKWRVAEACFISVATSTITFVLPLLARRCQTNASWDENSFGR